MRFARARQGARIPAAKGARGVAALAHKPVERPREPYVRGRRLPRIGGILDGRAKESFPKALRRAGGRGARLPPAS